MPKNSTKPNNGLSLKARMKKERPPKRQENLVFTIWVHTGYTVLILSMIVWMLALEFWI